MNFTPHAPRSSAPRALLALAVLMLSAACTTSGDSGGESEASCAYVVMYQNRTYSALPNAKITVGEKLGPATRPPCNDTPNDPKDEPTAPAPVAAYAVEGVDPDMAIWTEGASDDVIFVADEYDKELPPRSRS